MGLTVVAIAALSGIRYDRIRAAPPRPQQLARAVLRPVAAVMRGQKRSETG